MATAPHPAAVVWSIVRSLATVRRPRPSGSGSLTHERLQRPLSHLATAGPQALIDITPMLEEYLAAAAQVDPDRLDRDGALALWINLYNSGALLLAADAQRRGEATVLRIPGGFARPFITVAGEELSLDDIEHAKLRRFRDPRVHAALVCGSVSCPTLRRLPYTAPGLSDQLDDQLRFFLRSGGCIANRDADIVELSRVFLWFGADFVRRARMPTFIPAPRRAVLAALTPWLDADTRDWIAAKNPGVFFQPYDWGLRCSVR